MEPPDALAAAERGAFDAFGLTVTTRRVDLRRLNGSVRVVESGAGPALLLIHGAATAGPSWVHLMAKLPDFRCIAIDRPGCGLSTVLDPPPLDLASQRRVADLLVGDVLDGLDMDRAHVAANSLGGWYAFRSAAAEPSRVDRMLGFGFQVGAPISGAPLIMRIQAPAWLTPKRLRIGPAGVARMLKWVGLRNAIESGSFGEPGLRWMAALLSQTETMRNEGLHNPRPMGLRGAVPEVLHDDRLLSRIEAPVHFFWGTEEIFGDAEVARTFAGRFPSATVEMVDGAGHAPWIDAPERAAAAVRRHLTD